MTIKEEAKTLVNKIWAMNLGLLDLAERFDSFATFYSSKKIMFFGFFILIIVF